MPMVAFAMPLTPGKTQEWLNWSEELNGPRRAEYEASRRRIGLTKEFGYLQHTPNGDLAIIVLESGDLAHAMQVISTSQEPFDVDFRARAKEYFSGLDLSQPLPGPIAEPAFDLL